MSGLGFCQWPLRSAARLVPGPMRPESIGPSGYVVHGHRRRGVGEQTSAVCDGEGSSSDDVITDEIRVNI